MNDKIAKNNTFKRSNVQKKKKASELLEGRIQVSAYLWNSIKSIEVVLSLNDTLCDSLNVPVVMLEFWTTLMSVLLLKPVSLFLDITVKK